MYKELESSILQINKKFKQPTEGQRKVREVKGKEKKKKKPTIMADLKSSKSMIITQSLGLAEGINKAFTMLCTRNSLQT